MHAYAQLKVGPELLTPSRESWLGYYVFAFLTLGTLGGGWLWLRSSGLMGDAYWLALLAILILGTVCLGITIVCHLMGHLFDLLEDRSSQGGRHPG